MEDVHPFAVHFRDDKSDNRRTRSSPEGSAEVVDKSDNRRTRSSPEGSAEVVDKSDNRRTRSSPEGNAEVVDKSDNRRTRSSPEGSAEVVDKSDNRRTRSSPEGNAEVVDNPHAVERMGVYEQALALTTAIDHVVEKCDGRFHLKDLLDKSATMVVLRIAQAAGETAKGDRRKHYRIARRAATDCAAVLDILDRRATFDKPDEHRARSTPQGSAKSVDQALLAPARTIVLALILRLAHLAAR